MKSAAIDSLVIIDGYVDEPTVLGVPFYISTYVRYAAGAARLSGAGKVLYRTIDQLRDCDFVLPSCDAAILIAGNPVPGKYLGGMPILAGEFSLLARANKKTPIFAGGPAGTSAGFSSPEPNLHFVNRDIETFTARLVGSGESVESTRSIDELNRFSAAGAFIVEQHPRFPDVMIEIETGRGCKRARHCSFCIEGLHAPDHREPQDVIAEMKELAKSGARHFRLSKQADLYAYGSRMAEWRDGFAKPEVEAVRRLYEGIRDALPDLQTLHLDNVNPGTIARFPDESARITQIIAANNTEGDVAAMGMESADPEVVERNFLKASPEQIRLAVRIVNEFGGLRKNGVPKLLPGINLIRGLDGESRDTFRLNYEFLKSILDEGLLLRRINIRQLRLSSSTPIAGSLRRDAKEEKKLDAAFRNYRQKIRAEIDVPMLKAVYPVGTRLDNLVVEQNRGDWSLARQIATYPIVANLPKIYEPLSKLSVFVAGYRERSLVALPCPFDVKRASLAELKQLPGLGKRASEVFVRGPSPEDFESLPGYGEWGKYLHDS